MPIKVNGVFKTSSMSTSSKLLYIYLITHPQLDTVGVVQINLEVACLEVGLDIDEFRNSSSDLVKKNLLKVMSYNGDLYFLLLKHYASHSKGVQTVNNATKSLSNLPEKIKDWVEGFVNIYDKGFEAIEPTAQEIEDYAMSVGYRVDGQVVVDFYNQQKEQFRRKFWVDSRNKQIVDWKRKIKNVWCKESNKLKKNEDAPVGWEYFHILYGERIIYPDYWKGGYPWSREGLVITEELRKEYERQKEIRYKK